MEINDCGVRTRSMKKYPKTELVIGESSVLLDV